MKTIAEIAAECGVSSQTVRNEIKRKGFAKGLQKVGKGFAIDEESAEAVISGINSRNGKRFAKNDSQSFAESFAKDSQSFAIDLQKELDEKNALIASQSALIDRLQAELSEQAKQHAETVSELTGAISQLTESLHAAQALHAGTIQERLETNRDEPLRAVEDEPEMQDNEPETQDESIVKKWWQFWK